MARLRSSMEPCPSWRKGEVGRPFALFYTGVLGAGGLAPIVYGTIADHSNKTVAILAAALTAAAIIPMVLALRPFLFQVHDGAARRSDIQHGDQQP